jgi:hypothetical protein
VSQDTLQPPVDRGTTQAVDPTDVCERVVRRMIVEQYRPLSEWAFLARPVPPPDVIDACRRLTENAKTSSFLDRVYRLAESNQTRRAASTIMEYVDGLLHEGEFAACGRLLGRVDVSRLSKYPALLVAFLGITLGAKEKMPLPRTDFYSRARDALARELGPARAESILRRFQ